SLHTLDLSSNNIEFIPDGLFNLKSLDQLRLSYHKISNLSYKLGDLDNLVWCYFDNNKIKSLPASISKLESLDKLVLSNNMITDLPCEIGKLKLLVELYLDNNLISSLPESMLSMSAIDRLSLDKNKFTFDLSEIYGFEAIDKINYVINICNDKTTDLNEFKLLVVGDERVGKTSIINRINNDGFSDACESTQGID
ncbi:leucine-rich repeat domain-containing protein, partial [Photobacterium phosphoreum]|uniref:leucine-rich repeat domain-containing protein n=1 Tax=Photobacterium phosphoreum TaxID=659 RepID=UPI000D43E2ED